MTPNTDRLADFIAADPRHRTNLVVGAMVKVLLLTFASGLFLGAAIGMAVAR